MDHIISKQFAALATSWANMLKKDPFLKARLVLTALSVASLAIFLCIVTALVYILFIQNVSIDHPLIQNTAIPSSKYTQEYEPLHEAKEVLLTTMVLVDIVMILISILPLYIAIRSILAPIKKAHNTQKRLIADVSHELRTPLAIMLSGVENILFQQDISTQHKKSLHALCDDISYLKKITDDLLFIESGKDKQCYENTNLITLTKEILTMVSPYAHNKKIKCNLTETNTDKSILYANTLHIKRLILNIVKNAIDYSPSGSSVTVSIKNTDTTCILTVQDNGIGMHKKDVQKITDRFYKADTARNTTGAGLGLAIVAHIAKEHGATLKITSTYDMGTTVAVQFPLVSASS